MKNSIKIILGILAFFAVVWACTPKHQTTAVYSPNRLPTNEMVSCTVQKDTFESWKVPGHPGSFNPANSTYFVHNNNCDFYKWSEHMFLWLTSPAAQYGNKNSVLESPLFYNVTPEDGNSERHLIPHKDGEPLTLTAHVDKNGPDRLPVILSKTGMLFEVEKSKPSANAVALVKNDAGNPTEVSSVKLGANNEAIFLDKNGKVIAHPKAALRHNGKNKNIVEQFMAGGKPIFLDGSGHIIQTEAGQATGDVLMAQNGSLVYYLTLVNDMYAWFLTAVQDSAMTGNTFPTTPADRDSICRFARSHHAPNMPDSNALAMEIKTSWVEASTLKDPQDYFTVMATIPTYDTTNHVQWIPKSKKTVRMALVGIHIVGSASGHAEMIWATFEHQAITPNALYTYLDNQNNVDTIKQDTGSKWTFSSNASDPKPNNSNMTNFDSVSQVSSDTIFAYVGHTIKPSNTLMVNPWGSSLNQPTNAEDGNSATSNSEIISINNTIAGFLPAGDFQRNYLLIGATWTNGGVAPTGNSYGYKGDTTAGVAIGTSVLANSTMETYFQSDSTSCLFCHSGTVNKLPSLQPTQLSHIFGNLAPLIAASRNKEGTAKKSK